MEDYPGKHAKNRYLFTSNASLHRTELSAAIAGETHEFEHMYPEMIAAAQAEGNKAAERSFNYANEVEKVHAALYQKALDSLGKGGDVDYYVCSVCGYTAEGSAPDTCPVCGSKKQAFMKAE